MTRHDELMYQFHDFVEPAYSSRRSGEIARRAAFFRGVFLPARSGEIEPGAGGERDRKPTTARRLYSESEIRGFMRVASAIRIGRPAAARRAPVRRR